MKISRLILVILGSFFIGFVVAVKLWVNPKREALQVQADAYEKLDLLGLAQKGSIQDIQSKIEMELDMEILALGGFSSEYGNIGKSSQVCLRKIAKYRQQSNYSSQTLEIKQRVQNILEKYK